MAVTAAAIRPVVAATGRAAAEVAAAANSESRAARGAVPAARGVTIPPTEFLG